MSESEFKVKDPVPSKGPSFYSLMAQKIREGRREHPVADMVAGNLPIIGGIQAGLDVTDESQPGWTRALALASVVPGGKLAGAIVKRLRNYEHKIPAKVVDKLTGPKPPEPPEHTFEPEDIFQKPDVTMTPEQREAARVSMNEAYAKQLLEEEAKFQPMLGPKSLRKIGKEAGERLYGGSSSGLIFGKGAKKMKFADYVDDEVGPLVDTFDYVFKPSTGEGIEAADQMLSKAHVDVDGNIYLGGAEGILVLTDVPKDLK